MENSDTPLTDEQAPAETIPAEQAPVPELTTTTQILMPLRILASPTKSFSQLAQKPTAKGLISLLALILLATAAAQYASASRIILTATNGQPISLLNTDSFNGWYVGVFASTAINIFLYWVVFVLGLALISRTFGGKNTPWRTLVTDFGYVLSVFIILYAVRALMYLALPPITFNLSTWPPTADPELSAAVKLMQDTWGPILAYQIGTIFTFVALVWFVLLATIAVKSVRGVGWGRAAAVAAISFAFTLLLFGIP